MIEGIVVCVILILALIALHKWNKPKVVVGNLPPVTVTVPMPEVKPPAMNTKFGVPYGEEKRQPTKSTAFAAQYGTKTDWGRVAREEREAQERATIRRDAEDRARRQREREADERREREIYDTTPDLLTVVAVTAAYESFSTPVVDTSSREDYSSSTSSSSNWGGDSSSSSSSSDYSSSSSDSSSSSWSD